MLKPGIFIDRSVLEVFANEIVRVTKTISSLDSNADLEIHIDDGTANAKVFRGRANQNDLVGVCELPPALERRALKISNRLPFSPRSGQTCKEPRNSPCILKTSQMPGPICSPG